MNKYIRYGLVSVALVLTLSYCLKVSIADEATKHYEAGLDQYKKGWYDQAIREFEMAVELKQDYVSAHYGLGNAYYCKHLYDKAIKEYNKVLRYNPDHAKAHYALWLSYRALGMTGDAEKELEIYKKLSGQKGEEKAASDSSGYSEKRDYTRSDERTESWHVADSQAQIGAKAPTEGASHTEAKEQEAPAPQKQPEEEVKKQESHVPQEQPSEMVKKPEEPSALSEMLAQFEQRQKESASAPQPAQPTAQPAHQEQPVQAKEEAVAEAHKQAEAQHVAPSQPVVHEQPSAPVIAEVKTEGGITPQHTPPPAKVVEQGQASQATETNVHAPNQSGTESGITYYKSHQTQEPAPGQGGSVTAEVKETHIAAEKPREHVRGHGIKVRMEHVWKNAPMGKVIVSIAIYIFAAQVWIGIVATLGLLFLKKKQAKKL
ncbi:MAG TPA: tetratricopeptide repeat protein [Candidatus Brocadiia bacterium]|nr:tetratricopeptide repeat protein [Planctomycetota bacterium]MBI4008308.1 tetratricopeptide repeat protein [Planctomycetota bacterium]MDO8093296.1 tetratricopeptide repeat protein [Candidatus Brocadiales bacterium]